MYIYKQKEVMGMKDMTGFPSVDRVHLREYSEEELHPEVHPYSMFRTFMEWNDGYMNEMCILDGAGNEYGKKELEIEIRGVVKGLINLGLYGGANDVAVVALPNGFKTTAIVMALNAVGIKTFLVESNRKKAFEEVERRSAKIVFCIEEGTIFAHIGKIVADYDNFVLLGMKYVKECRVDEMIQKFSEYDDEPLIFLQTSGSTSEPKVLPFKNSAIYAAMVFALNSTHIDNRDPKHRRLMTLLSIRLPFGFMTGFLPILWGQEVVYASGVAKKDIANYYKYEASLIFGTPTLLEAFMALTPEDADLSALIGFYSSGFATAEDLFTRARMFFEAHGSKAELRNNYGFGEGLGVGTASDHVPHIPGANGKFYRGPEWVIVDDDFNEVEYRKLGELIVDSKTLCEGYLENPEATAAAFVPFRGKTFFRTGDIVSVDEEGYVYYFGRKKRFYQPLGAGDKVSCDLVEKALLSASFVKQAVVVPVPDKELVTVGKAFVVFDRNDDLVAEDGLDKNEDLARELIFMDLDRALENFQLPKTIVFLDEIPMMKSGKPDYRKLQEM